MNQQAEYFDAFCRVSCGSWYPDLFFKEYYILQPYFQYESFKHDDENWIVIERIKNDLYRIMFDDGSPEIVLPVNESIFGFKFLHDFYYRLAYEYIYEHVPIFSMLFSCGLVFWLILLATFYCIYKKDYCALFPISFIIGLWGTIILGPLTIWRYTFPLMMTIPILFAQAFSVPKTQEK